MPTELILGLVIGLALLIFLILKTKIHAFLALIISAVVIGLIAGLGPSATVSAISTGFGNTLGNIGIIIGFGVMMGQIFQISGAAERMARTFLKIFGKGKEEFALALTGFIVSIPIFCDSGFVILSPLARALSRETKKSIVGLGVPLAAGLVITHSLIPPTPGPVSYTHLLTVEINTRALLDKERRSKEIDRVVAEASMVEGDTILVVGDGIDPDKRIDLSSFDKKSEWELSASELINEGFAEIGKRLIESDLEIEGLMTTGGDITVATYRFLGCLLYTSRCV